MKLIVKQKGKRGIRLWFPNRLLFSKTAFKIFRRSAAGTREKMENQLPEDGQLVEEEEILTPGLKWAMELKEHKKALEASGADDIEDSIREEIVESDHGQGFDFQAFMASLPDEKVDQVMRIFRNMRKDHPGVPLVDVHSSDGDRVLIQL